MLYYGAIETADGIISVDRLIIQFTACQALVDNVRDDFVYLNGMFPWMKYEDTDSRKYHFCHSYSARYDNGTMTVLLLHNSKDYAKCRIIVNPNKCFNNPYCVLNIKTLLAYAISYEIHQLDIAFDIPTSPNFISFVKDQRSSLKYSRGRDDKTEYLGKNRNKTGHVKKYDKAKESNLDHPMTRIEITVGNPAEQKFRNDLIRHLPETYVRVGQGCLEQIAGINLSSTENVLVDLLINHPDKIAMWKRLGRKEQAKLKALIFSNERKIEYNIDVFLQIAYRMLDILNYDFAHLENGVFKSIY